MQNSFSDFVNNQQNNQTNNQFEQAKEKVQQEDMSGFEELIKNYSSYSEEELISEFLRLTKEGKQNGTLNTESLKQLSQTIKPMLTPKQQKMLDMFLNYVE